MFINNKYTKWYYNIVTSAEARPKLNQYTENHHIIPKSLGGKEMVALTAKEHFICHWLLTKMLKGDNKKKMCYAFHFMSKSNKHHKRYKMPAYLVEKLKNEVSGLLSELHKGKTVSKETRQKLSASRKGIVSPNKGKKMSEEQKQKISETRKKRIKEGKIIISKETRQKISDSNTGKTRSADTKKKMSDSHKNRIYKPMSEEQKQKISETLKGRQLSDYQRQKIIESNQRRRGIKYRKKI